jgi:hypothetical protein
MEVVLAGHWIHLCAQGTRPRSLLKAMRTCNLPAPVFSRDNVASRGDGKAVCRPCGGDLQNVQHKDGAYRHVLHALRLSALGPVKGTQLDTVDGDVRFSALFSAAGDGKPDARSSTRPPHSATSGRN